MTRQSRLAVGTVDPGDDGKAMRWALLHLLECFGLHVQAYSSQARFDPVTGAFTATGQTRRHLDSWLMKPEVCRALFLHGMADCDLAVVEGQWQTSNSVSHGAASTSRLETLADWLDLPRIAIVNARQLSGCRLPRRPEGIQGIFLDRAPDTAQTIGIQTNLEAIWGVPVLGVLPEVPRLRQMVDAKAGPSPELCELLAEQLAPSLRFELLQQLAQRGKLPAGRARLWEESGEEATRCNVAVAYDDAFNCYFPDTLDLLELQGASIQDVSPLHNESLPPDTDIVYLGCGRIGDFAEALASNYCFHQALKKHVLAGKRIYAECAGLAYLCEDVTFADGRAYALSGVLPARAQQSSHVSEPEPVELTLSETCWLGRSGSKLRGYRNPAWAIEPILALSDFADGQLWGVHHAVGSQVHLNFAGQPEYLQRFFEPVATSMSLAR